MARIRSIKPEFFEDELLGSLSRDARLLFVGLWTVADDHGRFRASPVALKAAVFPYDEDVTATTVSGLLLELTSTRRVLLWEVEGQRYGLVRNWKKHQRIDNAGKTKYPDPPEGLEDRAVEVPEQWVRGESREVRGEIPRVSLSSPLEGIGVEGKGREGGLEPAEKPAGSASPTLPCSPEVVRTTWNAVGPPVLPAATTLTEKRQRAVRARLGESRDRVEDWWRTYFTKIRGTPFLCGDNDRGWRADFDFAIKADSIAKVHEGKYDRAGPSKRQADDMPNLNRKATT